MHFVMGIHIRRCRTIANKLKKRVKSKLSIDTINAGDYIFIRSMEEKQKITIFHLYRKDGSSLFLHPFEKEEKFMELLEKLDFEGKYGQEPRVESLTMFKNDIYRLIEDAVKSYVSELRFIPKFLISAGIFLAAYLFFSLVVRDPLPMVDEILISFGAAILSYIMIGRRDQRSNLSLKKRMEMRTRVDRIVFNESSFVKKIEKTLHQNESGNTEKVIEYMMSPGKHQISAEDEKDALQLIKYLKKRFNSRDFKRQERIVDRLIHEKDKEPEKDKKSLSVWAESKKVDFSLFAVYARMKKDFEKVR